MSDKSELGTQLQAALSKAHKPTVYLYLTDDAIGLSAYPMDHPGEEKYTMELREVLGTGRNSPSHISITILRNILEQAGVSVVIED